MESGIDLVTNLEPCYNQDMVHRIKEVDDLAIVECGVCHNMLPAKKSCFQCHGSGDVVMHTTRYYELSTKDKASQKRFARH